MKFTMVRQGKPLRIQLTKDLTRNIKRGHAWLFSNAIETVKGPAGSVGILIDRKTDDRLASGIYDPNHALPLRICRTEHPFSLDDTWMHQSLSQATSLRSDYFDDTTTGYRLIAGEGDGLPGLIVDRYASTAVLKLDSGAPEAFYQPAGIADWLTSHLPIDRVVQRFRQRGRAGEMLKGSFPEAPIPFLENNNHFSADVIHGQKTGFFLDQRDNRQLIQRLARHKTVLNLFSFNGGFSVAAGQGGARNVTSVDIAPAAIDAAKAHWEANELDPTLHQGFTEDCFQFLEQATQGKQLWDIVICDPPSFAPSENARPQALAAYGRLAQSASKVTKPGGLLALASCSSHVDHDTFLINSFDALGRARRKATLLADRGLPIDHPTPLAMPELRYLKFLLFRLN